MGVGAWSWGDRFYWGYGRKFGRRDVGEAFHISLEAGLDFFDTAEAYGQGSSEIILGELEREAGARLIIASKFMPFPWRLRKQDLLSVLRRSLRRLGRDRLELYQIHWPLPPVPIETWMEGMADALRVGLVSAVGVSNYNLGQMQRAVSTLHRFGIPLRSNQVLYSLMDREPERSGLLEACQRQGIALIAYSPLAQGLLTGKYSLNAPPPLHRRMRAGRARLARAEAIVNVMRNIGEGYGGKSPSQVALNWVIRKGAIPIPGAKDGKQAEDNLGALGWQLSDEDVQQLDRASAGY
jgi:aryl-alcohol dehydrogenase-like predicted oxidoreductase